MKDKNLKEGKKIVKERCKTRKRGKILKKEKKDEEKKIQKKE